MSLYGSSYPKFQNSSGTVTVELPYSIVEPTFAVPNEVMQEYLDGTRDFIPITNNDHAEFVITVNLHKYGNLTARRNKFKEIHAYNHQNVRLFVNSDGEPLKGSDGNPVLFHITKIDLYWKEKTQMYDTMAIYLKSLSPVDIDYGW